MNIIINVRLFIVSCVLIVQTNTGKQMLLADIIVLNLDNHLTIQLFLPGGSWRDQLEKPIQ